MRLFPIQMPSFGIEEQAVKDAGFGSLCIIPWDMIAPHEPQALRNHSQTLDELARRCGLSACEALAVLEDRYWRSIPVVESYRLLDAKVREWHKSNS